MLRVSNRIATLITLGALTIAISRCGTDARSTPSAPSTISTSPGGIPGNVTVTGIVRAIRPRSFTTQPPQPPGLSGTTVTFLTEGVTGLATTTGDNGAYTLTVPREPFRLQYSRPGYVTALSSLQNDSVRSALAVSMPDVTLDTAPWTVSGRVIDGRGNPIPNVLLTFGGDLFREAPYGSTTTDGGGQYRFGSNRSHFDTISVGGSVIGADFGAQIPCCNPPADSVFDIRVVHIVSLTPYAPGTLHLGEQVELPPVEEVLDDGTSKQIFVLPVSNAPTVVSVGRGQRGFTVTGAALGSATLAFEDHHFTSAMQVQVVP